MQPNTMLVEVYRLTGEGKVKAGFVVPLNAVFEKLRETGRLASIESTGDEKEMERQKEAWKHAGSESIQGMAAQAPEHRVKEAQELEIRLKDLEDQKQSLAKSFMKREVAYNEYTTLMTNISKEMLEIRTKLDHAKKD